MDKDIKEYIKKVSKATNEAELIDLLIQLKLLGFKEGVNHEKEMAKKFLYW